MKRQSEKPLYLAVAEWPTWQTRITGKTLTACQRVVKRMVHEYGAPARLMFYDPRGVEL